MIYSWTLTNATITAEWMHRFIKPSTIWSPHWLQHPERKPIMIQPRDFESDILNNLNRPDLQFSGELSPFVICKACEICQKRKKKKKKRNSSSPIKKRNLSAGNFCHQTSALSYLNTQNTEGRKGGSVFAVEGILKSSEESKTRKNPEQTKKKPHRAKQRSMKHQEG